MAKQIEKLGYNIEVQGFVIHKINKIAGERKATLKLANSVILPTAKERRFIKVTSDAYYKKSAPTYGIFEDSDANKFQKELIAYKSKRCDFLSFSHNCMEYYKDIISDVAPATGGFMVFAHYTNTEKKAEYMLILSINNKDGYVFNENNLTLEDTKNIELNKIDLACQINLSKWNNFTNKSDPEVKTYLSLIKGSKDLSAYFMKFIGNANKTTSTESSKRLVNTLDRFCKKEGYDREETIRKKNLVSNYCIERMKGKQEISLAAISALINPENPNSFQEYASDEENEVDEIISGDPKILRRIGFVKYKDKDENLSIEFGNELIGKRIFYDNKKKQLTIKDILLADQIPD
jgi:nucleoid-associated protein YejK